MFVDTHTHLFLPEFDNDRHEAVSRAIQAGVDKMVLPNVDVTTIEPLLKLADQFPAHCYPSLGLHPTSVRDNYRDELAVVQKYLEQRKFYAIGETGIDLYRDKTRLAQQLDAFRVQLELAKQYRLPVIIHCRESFDEIYEVVLDAKSECLTGIFHSFTGTIEQAGKVIDAGFMIGIGGILTFRNAGLEPVVRDIPLEKVLLETDSPYLAPVPYRGRRNESAYLVHTARKLAEILHLSTEKLAKTTSENAVRIFGFKED